MQKQTFLEFWEMLSQKYIEILSYAYHCEVSINTMIELVKI